ncbi:methionine--tRNA ligase [Pseudoramibacter alactolyticus]
MSEEKKTFYMTTPIYYPSGDLHIGHTYTTVAADTLTRFKRQQGYDAYMLTGSDEHGQKIQKIAEEKGMTPKAYVDGTVAKIKELWKLMNIDYSQFIRTTDADNVKSVQKIFKRLYDQGDIYKGRYEGWYCTPDEAFWTDTQVVDGKCPDCGRPVERASEEAYFFRMSKYADRLLDYIESHPGFIQPEARQKEMINNFIKPGLQDLCVSRTSFDWGIPVEFDPGHVVYVWIDALSNYITALGYLNDKPQLMDRYWPADLHLVGKDIIRFHTIYWPIMLMALDLPLPKTIYGHGWILLKGGKMSKSVGNVVDPVKLIQKYGVDPLRYHVLKEMKYGADGSYSEDLLIGNINADLANDLGNLLSRTVAMTVKYFGGVIPETRLAGDHDADLKQTAEAAVKNYAAWMDKFDFSRALESVWQLIGRANKYIDETEPWVLGKDAGQRDRLAAVLYNLTESLRIVAVLIAAAMPDTSAKMIAQLKVPAALATWDSIQSFGGYPFGIEVARCEPLYPRIDLKQLAKEKQTKQVKPKKAKQPKSKKEPAAPGVITMDDFVRVQMRVADVISCEKHPDADKLLVFQLDFGTEKRQIISGIAKWYRPEELVGKKIIACTNLKPVKLRGMDSNGMILSAEKDGELRVLTVDGDMPAGSIVG